MHLTPTSQNAAILDYLRGGKSITPLEALKMFGSLRLAARIYDLKRAGHTFAMYRREVSPRKRVAVYTLLKEAK